MARDEARGIQTGGDVNQMREFRIHQLARLGFLLIRA